MKVPEAARMARVRGTEGRMRTLLLSEYMYKTYTVHVNKKDPKAVSIINSCPSEVT
jgi:hypothetical protein